MNNTNSLAAMTPTPDVYTDLQGLQRLRANPDKDAALRQVAQQFESMFMSMLLKNMRQANAVFEEGGMFDNNESRLIRDMYDQQLSLTLSQNQGTGLADVLYRQMSGQYNTATPPATGADEAGAHVEGWRRGAVTPANNSASLTGNSTPAQPAGSVSNAGQRAALAETPADFVERLLPFAQRAASQLGTDAKVLLAQAALETGWGKYVLADQHGASSNNVFNIKAKAGWTGETVAVQALEYRDGVAVREQSQFKKYAHLADSFDDFVELVKTSPRYREALEAATDAEQFVRSLHAAGYATDPQYTDKVMSVYQDINHSANAAEASKHTANKG